MAIIEDASPICRGKNLSWETVMLFYNHMPKEPLPKDKFNAFVERNINSWTQTHSQIARQIAFYYEEDGICYPRFTKSSTLADLFAYMVHWAHNYFVPNPYAPSLRGQNPTSIYAHIVKCIEHGITNFDEAVDSMFGVPLSSHDKVRVYLQNYTNLKFEDGLVSINSKIQENTNLLIPDKEAAINAKSYFRYFGQNHSNSSSDYYVTSLFSYSPYLTALRTKPFLLLAGISGTGKSRIVREMAFKSCPSYLRDKDGTTPGNYCMIEVKPNWHDSSELLGYYSNISKKYIFTKFVKFLVRAMMHPDIPFFVCLDEMNLAPVEQYFAEFLSVLETRKIVKEMDIVATGNLVSAESFTKKTEKYGSAADIKFPTDKEWFYEFFSEDTISEKERAIIETHTDQTLSHQGLSLPENVFIIGTVNMDDTTHQFSRKVIDRAMTIEMNGGKLEDMFGGSSDLEYPKEPDDEILSMATLKARYVSADDVLEKCDRIKSDATVLRFVTGKDSEGNILPEEEDTLPRRLNAINKILENTPFQISYRVFNELVIYLGVLCDDPNNNDKDVINDLATLALDQIALMKILPRIEGDYDMFNVDGGKNKLEQLQDIFPKDKTKSGDKLDEMNKRLTTTEFTRFWP